MLKKISKNMAHFFVVQNAAKPEYEEVYAYGAEILLSTIINGCIAATIAILTKTIIPSIIFLTVFIIMRRTAGGYHADTHMGCMGINANNLSDIGIYPAKKSNRIFWTKHLALMRKFRTRSRPTFNHRNRLFQA